jgi:HEAT repeat protein/energy-coupling factor transporter ATP-binding protein EcfA2
MTHPDELVSILDHILNGSADEGDIAILRQSLTASAGKNVVQLGKYNVNIGEGKDIHIGDKVYQGADADTIRTILVELLSQNSQQIEIDWHNISQTMLSEQLRLTTNPLTSGEGITYRTEQVYVPLGLVERKKPTRRREDVSPERGSELYRETEITQTFEHQQFLEQVLRDRQSPKSQRRGIAIIGEPGAGKTTLLQQIAQWLSAEMAQSVVIWVSLADLRSRELESYLLEVWLQAVARKVGQAEASTQIKDDFVAQFNQGLVWLLLDGVDEMQATVGNPLGEIERQIRMGTLLQQALIVLSCRLNLWDGGSNALDSFDNYRTLEFSYPQQVEQFIGNWFGSLPSAQTQTGQRLCAALREAGKERIRDLAKNPLRLTLLCFNWYLGEGKLPETKAGLYEQFVADFYEWKKKLFATTGEQRKRLNTALGELAREAIDKEATRFRLRQEFVCEYLGEPDDPDSLFGLALWLGWLNKVGVEAENPRKAVYAFLHPTFQEYFAALAIDDWHYFLNHIPDNPSHSDANYRIFELQWKQVLLLWLGRENILENQKESFINALVDFEDRWGDFYKYRAYFLAASGIAEFINSSKANEIVKNIIDMSFNYDLYISKEAKLMLVQTDQNRVVNNLSNLLENADKIPIKRIIAQELGRVEPHNQKAISILSCLLEETDIRPFERASIAQQLGEVDPGNLKALSTLLEMLHVNKNDAWWAANGKGEVGDGSIGIFAFSIIFAVAALEKISDGSEEIVKALIEVLNKSKITDINDRVILSFKKFNPILALCILNPAFNQAEDEQNYLRIAELLGKIDSHSWKVIGAFLELLNSENEDIKLEALRSLGNVGENMPEAILCYKAVSHVVNLLDDDEWKYWRGEIAVCLGKIGASEPNVIKALTTLLEDTEDEETRIKAAISLKKIKHSHLEATDFLLDFVCNDQFHSYEEYIQEATESLKQSRETNQLLKIVSTLRKYLNIQNDTMNPEIYETCLDIIWYCSQNLSFPEFYQVWEGEPIIKL